MSLEIRLEQLLGRLVRDVSGKSVGHIEEIEAEWQGGELVVTRYLLGARGLLERLSLEVWRSHEAGVGPSYAARWDQIDVTRPEQPRLTCPIDELDRLE